MILPLKRVAPSQGWMYVLEASLSILGSDCLTGELLVSQSSLSKQPSRRQVVCVILGLRKHTSVTKSMVFMYVL